MVYLDSATVNPLPDAVVTEMAKFMEFTHYFPNKGMHDLTIRSTRLYNLAKQRLGKFLGIPHLIYQFPPNVTMALANLILGTTFQKGDSILLTASANHALLGPIIQLAEKLHYSPKICPLDPSGQADLGKFEELLKTQQVKLAIWPLLPIGTGIEQESRPLIELTRKYGTTSIIDLTRALGHVPIQFAKESPDIIMGNCWTGLYAPQGAAFFGINENLLSSFAPPILGEGNIAEASWTHVTPNLQSGTIAGGDINMVSIAGLDAGLIFYAGNSPPACIAHEQELLTEIIYQLRGIPRCHIVGSADVKRSLLVSFSIEGMNAHDIGMYMNELHHTIVRTGQLCAQPLLTDLSEPNVVQVSVAPFIEEADIEKFAYNLKEIIKEMG